MSKSAFAIIASSTMYLFKKAGKYFFGVSMIACKVPHRKSLTIRGFQFQKAHFVWQSEIASYVVFGGITMHTTKLGTRSATKGKVSRGRVYALDISCGVNQQWGQQVFVVDTKRGCYFVVQILSHAYTGVRVTPKSLGTIVSLAQQLRTLKSLTSSVKSIVVKFAQKKPSKSTRYCGVEFVTFRLAFLYAIEWYQCAFS